MSPPEDDIPFSGRYGGQLGESSPLWSEDEAIGRDFATRLSDALGKLPQSVVAKRARVSTSVMSKYMAGSEPGLFKAARLARELGVSLNWLATGQGKPNAESLGFVSVPIYDVRLAAGAASFTEGAKVIGEAPIDSQLLRQLGRSNAEGLGMVEAEGDSMFPTIPDGARVLLDLKDTRLRDGIFGFRYDHELRVKRLRRTAEGVEILSDNPRYPPERLEGQGMELFSIIGRVAWVGAIL
jgi:phage repressor protein C with HTH and peptisase S24 domain